MQQIQRSIVKYRSVAHTCVSTDTHPGTNTLTGPTRCSKRTSCYAFPRSVKMENCAQWVHKCSVMWTQQEWDTLIAEWTRATGNPTTWRLHMKHANIVWFPVQNPGAIDGGIKTKHHVGFVLPGMSPQRPTTTQLKFTLIR